MGELAHLRWDVARSWVEDLVGAELARQCAAVGSRFGHEDARGAPAADELELDEAHWTGAGDQYICTHGQVGVLGGRRAAHDWFDEGGFFDLTTTDVTGVLRKQTIRTLETMSIPVEYSFHEDAPSQHEIDLRHTDALTMADSIMTFRLVVREVAAANGVHATFTPKPMEGVQGSGMHVHLSLFQGEQNAFHDPDDGYSLSPIAKSFMAGLLRHAAEITAITNQTVNSYKRLVPGFEAPVHVSWARNNRSGLIRVPIAKRGNPSATRLEYRSPDPACNPYLAFSVILAAGMRGVADEYELPAEADANMFEMSDEALRKLGIEYLPMSLNESLRAMESSTLVQEALGDHIFEWFLRNKRSEWKAYKTHISAFEHERYLRAL